MAGVLPEAVRLRTSSWGLPPDRGWLADQLRGIPNCSAASCCRDDRRRRASPLVRVLAGGPCQRGRVHRPVQDSFA